MASETNRRTLFSGAAAIVIEGGITAGLAVPIADFAEPSCNSDAALIALCREYVEHATRHSEFCAKQDVIPERKSAAEHAEWMRLDDLTLHLGERMGELEEQIPELPALTPAGQRAKAAALLLCMRYISHQHGGTFARSLAHDLVGRV